MWKDYITCFLCTYSKLSITHFLRKHCLWLSYACHENVCWSEVGTSSSSGHDDIRYREGLVVRVLLIDYCSLFRWVKRF